MFSPRPFKQRYSLRRIRLVTRGDFNIPRELGFGIHNEVNLVAEEKIIFAFSSPLGIGIRVASRATTFALTLASLVTELTGISPDMSGVDGSITTLDYFQDNSLSDQLVEDFIKNILSQPITEIGETTIGRSLQKIKTAEETQPSIVT
jgi:hypothetical protein